MSAGSFIWQPGVPFEEALARSMQSPETAPADPVTPQADASTAPAAPALPAALQTAQARLTSDEARLAEIAEQLTMSRLQVQALEGAHAAQVSLVEAGRSIVDKLTQITTPAGALV